MDRDGKEAKTRRVAASCDVELSFPLKYVVDVLL